MVKRILYVWCFMIIGFVVCRELIWCLLVGKIFAQKFSYDSDSSSVTIASSEKVLVPGGQSDGSSSLPDQLESPSTISDDSEVCDLLRIMHCILECLEKINFLFILSAEFSGVYSSKL